MLLAQEISTGWLLALGGVIGGLGTLLGIWLRGRREEHADSVKDYKEMYLTSQKERAEDKAAARKDVHDLRDEYNQQRLKDAAEHATELLTLQERLTLIDRSHQQALSEAARRCDDKVDRLTQQNFQYEREKGEMVADIRAMHLRMQFMESAANVQVLPQPGVIVVKMDGNVLVYSPSLTGFTGWEPRDVQGKNIRMLMIDEEAAKYEAGVKSVMEGRSEIDPTKPILAHIRHKDGKRQVPVTIFLDGRMVKDMGQVVATISERPTKVRSNDPNKSTEQVT